MSRIGKLPVKIPSGVTVTISDHTVVVTSGKSELSRNLNPQMRVSVKDGLVVVERPSESKVHRSLHGLTRTLVWNMIEGASKEEVGQVAAEVRKIRPPEPYKGKGILYRGERVRRKAGKTGKTATGATK